MRDSNETINGAKPNRKRDSGGFPLYLHKTGQYAKRVRGRVHYFGKDREQALAKWLIAKDSLQAGLIVRKESKPTDVTLKTSCDTFADSKSSLLCRQANSHCGRCKLIDQRLNG